MKIRSITILSTVLLFSISLSAQLFKKIKVGIKLMENHPLKSLS